MDCFRFSVVAAPLEVHPAPRQSGVQSSVLDTQQLVFKISKQQIADPSSSRISSRHMAHR
jgi:hypothetical protein